MRRSPWTIATRSGKIAAERGRKPSGDSGAKFAAVRPRPVLSMPIPSSGARPYRAGRRRASGSRARRPGADRRARVTPNGSAASHPLHTRARDAARERARPMGTAHGGASTGATSGASSDVLTDDNSLPLRRLRQATVRDGDDPPKVRHDADLEEIVEKLEWAYLNREKLAEIGARAARDMT